MSAETKELREMVYSLQKQLKEMTIEYDNYRKRTQKEKEELALNGGKEVIQAILPSVDDLERAITHMVPAEDEGNAIFQKGVCLVYAKLIKALEEKGLKYIPTRGRQFSPMMHEAVGISKKTPKNKIAECVQRGYTLNGEVIRHSKVIVGI